jgi:hypothetical protein
MDVNPLREGRIRRHVDVHVMRRIRLQEEYVLKGTRRE